MPDARDGFPSFADEVDPSVLNRIVELEAKPALSELVARLRSHASRKAFLDTYAEVVVAHHLNARGFALRFEVPTPRGRRSDFEVAVDSARFYLHVKRLNTDRPPHNPRSVMAAASRLRALERIARPYTVQVRWQEDLNREQMNTLVSQASEFILNARLGDEMRATDHDGRELGGVRIIAPSADDHVNVTIGLPSGFTDQAPRFRRLMHRAYQQFMPRAVNVIVMCSDHTDDARDYETALLGSHIERWDAYPPRGKRVAYGRASDGFWHGHRFAESWLAGWFRLSLRGIQVQPRLWEREGSGAEETVRELVRRVLA